MAENAPAIKPVSSAYDCFIAHARSRCRIGGEPPAGLDLRWAPEFKDILRRVQSAPKGVAKAPVTPILLNDPFPAGGPDDLIGEYAWRRKKSSRSEYQVRAMMRRLTEMTGVNDLAALTREQVQSWVDELEKSRSSKTVKSNLAWLRILGNFAIERDYLKTENPAAKLSHFECDDLYPSYGHHWLQRAEPVISPIGEALPNTEIFRRLAARFSFDDPCFGASDRELMDDAVDPGDRRLHGRRGSELPVGEAVRMNGPDGRPLAVLDNVMPATPSGRIELTSDVLAGRWGQAARLPGYRPRASKFPLSLISPSSASRISSTLLGRGGKSGEAPALLMNPKDAGSRGLNDKRSVRVWNDRGAVILKLEITDAVPAGVVASEKGAWLADESDRPDD